MGIPKNELFIVENPTKMDDVGGYPHFRKPPYGGLWVCSAWEARLLLCHWWSLIMVMMTMIMIQTGSSKLQSKGVDSAVSDMKNPIESTTPQASSTSRHGQPLGPFFRVLSLVLWDCGTCPGKSSARFEEKLPSCMEAGQQLASPCDKYISWFSCSNLPMSISIPCGHKFTETANISPFLTGLSTPQTWKNTTWHSLPHCLA